MGRQRLLWRLCGSFLLIAALVAAAVAFFAENSFRDFHLASAQDDLKARAHLAAEALAPAVRAGDRAAANRLCQVLGASSQTRITVILPDGVVIADSKSVADEMERHGDRPEIVAALAAGEGASVRRSYTLGTDMVYGAVALDEGGRIVAVVRAAVPLRSLEDALRPSLWSMALGALVILLIAAGVSAVISRRISRPIEEIKRVAQRLARGDLDARLPQSDALEFTQLAEAINAMAAQLADRIRSVALERNEKDAILASMVEGLLAVDTNERVLSINRAARAMLGIAGEAVGSDIQEVVRNPRLHDLLATALNEAQPVEGETTLRNGGDRFLQVHATPLCEADGHRIGALIVLNDVTRLRRLEGIRRDFVANVSHELKTPITSIKGFVDTLIEGAMKDPERCAQFLGIVARQTDRMNAIVEDLLLLSSVEQKLEGRELTRAVTPLGEVVREAIEVSAPKAAAKQMTITLHADAQARAPVNAPLLVNAVVNLIDNAIKYSDPGKEVVVEAAAGTSEATITVRDQGCGIAEEHWPRLFERFYRVDTARSRKLGGTGLGLAIVKHILQAHGGSVSVTSAVGRGSAFTLRLPTV